MMEDSIDRFWYVVYAIIGISFLLYVFNVVKF